MNLEAILKFLQEEKVRFLLTNSDSRTVFNNYPQFCQLVNFGIVQIVKEVPGLVSVL